MGEGFLRFYKNSIKKEYKLAFCSTFVILLLIHLYKFANTLPNHDSLYNYYSSQNVVGSGRWALTFACGISSYWDLPWVNGLLSCVFIALTVVVIVALFNLKNHVLIVLIGALFAASPSTTETLFFLFTADGYMLAMLLAALAVYFSKIGENRVLRLIISGICICITCAIYQAYVSFALVLALCYLIDNLLLNNHEKKDYLKWVILQVIIYVVSLSAYYLIWKVCLSVSGRIANDYQGISEVGKISLDLLAGGFIRSIKSIVMYFMQWDVFEYGFTLYSILSILFVVIMITGLVIAFIKSRVIEKKWAAVLFLLAVVAIIPFSCIWHFASSSVGYRPMMLQCMTILFMFTAVLYERWANQVIKNGVCLFLVIIVFNNALMANISYYYMNLSYERTYAEGVEMMIEIHNLQDQYDIKKIAIVGNRLDKVQWEVSNPNTGEIAPAGKIHTFIGLIETNLLIDAEHTVPFLQKTLGLELSAAPKSTISELAATPIVQNMGCWPSGDSMKVIEDILVIKLADE